MRYLLVLSALLLLVPVASCVGWFGVPLMSTTDNDSGLNLGPNPNPNPNPNPDPDPNDSGNDIVVTAGTGINPIYTWEGGMVHSVSVMRTTNPTMPVWAIAFLGTTDGIESGVTHGTVPGGTVVGINTEPTLTPGVEYRVSVARHAGDDNSGWIEFTP